MLPAEPVLLAAKRWMSLLRSSSVGKATAVIRADPGYTDLTATQYSLGLDWLTQLGAISRGPGDQNLLLRLRQLPEAHAIQAVFETALEVDQPAWLRDADLLVLAEDELPQDASLLSEALGVTRQNALLSVRTVHGKVSLAERDRLGAAGEKLFVALLERQWPGSTTHVSLDSDGWGYDIVFRHEQREWHLEVKTTTRRGRLVIYLSRHEHEVARLDPSWRLVVVGLDEREQVAAIASAHGHAILERAPSDTVTGTRWQAASYQLQSGDLTAGLTCLEEAYPPVSSIEQILYCGQSLGESPFSWMPSFSKMRSPIRRS